MPAMPAPTTHTSASVLASKGTYSGRAPVSIQMERVVPEGVLEPDGVVVIVQSRAGSGRSMLARPRGAGVVPYYGDNIYARWSYPDDGSSSRGVCGRRRVGARAAARNPRRHHHCHLVWPGRMG